MRYAVNLNIQNLFITHIKNLHNLNVVKIILDITSYKSTYISIKKKKSNSLIY